MKTGLRKRGTVEATGETENCTERVRLSVPTSLSLCRDEDGDDNASLAGVAINERGEAELLSVGYAPPLREAGRTLNAGKTKDRRHPQGLPNGKAYAGAYRGYQAAYDQH
jgi:hypothetical protein